MKTALRASWFPRVGWEGLGNAKMKHEKWFGVLHGSQEVGWEGAWVFLMVPKSGWEGLGKANNET